MDRRISGLAQTLELKLQLRRFRKRRALLELGGKLWVARERLKELEEQIRRVQGHRSADDHA